jgi:N6-L-threonylcarbamoyladenine synthase
MYYLSIETSCDEASLCLMKLKKYQGEFVTYINSFEVVSSVVSSQINVHREFGGVVPEIGARQHAQYIHLLFKLLLTKFNQGVQETIQTTNLLPQDVDISNYNEVLSNIQTIFVTATPGLTSALKVGIEFAKSLKYYLSQCFHIENEIVHINHLHGHMISCFYDATLQLPDREVFPHLHLLVSGGNSQILLSQSPQDWKIAGQTLDDAAGESFDKTGRLLGLPYPAGVSISKIANTEKPELIHKLPRGMLKSSTFDYSFSGLKTAVTNYLIKNNFKLEQKLNKKELDILLSHKLIDINDSRLRFIKEMCVSIEYVIVEQLIRKFKSAQCEYNPVSIGLSGGVSANSLLRSEFLKLSKNVFVPPMYLTGDNAIMIGLSGLSRNYKK